MLPALAVAQAAVPEIARACGGPGRRRVARVALVLASCGASAGALLVPACDGPLITLFTGDEAVRGQVSAVLVITLASTLVEAASAVMGFALTAMKRSGLSLGSLAVGWSLLAVAAGPVVEAWGLAGLWTAMLANNVLLATLQGCGFLSVTGDGPAVK
ncbi:hypothetical protein ACFSKW_47745 [Nonomuraea mangrovi]|uniref:Uncharacterized protein n=1 Tax=Nonomuraea mangrovi TaxID=2316207 RepID=A0ABW4TBT4_9ACTN